MIKQKKSSRTEVERKIKSGLLILTIFCLSMSSCDVIRRYRYLNDRANSVVVQDCQCFDPKEVVEVQDCLQYFYLGNIKTYFKLRRIIPGRNGASLPNDCIGLFLFVGDDSRTGRMWEYPVIRLSDTILTPVTDRMDVQQDSIQMVEMLMGKLSLVFDTSTAETICHRFMRGRRQVATWRALY